MKSKNLISNKLFKEIEGRARGERYPWTCPECSLIHKAQDYFCRCGIASPRSGLYDDILCQEIKRLRKLLRAKFKA